MARARPILLTFLVLAALAPATALAQDAKSTTTSVTPATTTTTPPTAVEPVPGQAAPAPGGTTTDIPPASQTTTPATITPAPGATSTTTKTTTTAITPEQQRKIDEAKAQKEDATAQQNGDHALTIAAIVLAAILITLLALWALSRWRGWDPRWMRRWRHAVAESGWRLSLGWAEFRDFLHLGR